MQTMIDLFGNVAIANQFVSQIVCLRKEQKCMVHILWKRRIRGYRFTQVLAQNLSFKAHI